MENVKISVLIPIYNVENYLRECLDSIVAQTFQNFEVICVDDGSNDKSFTILQEYANKDKRFIIKKQEHKGVGTARNIALSLAKSKYVQFLDSDDFFEPQMFEEMYNTAVIHDADMVICSAIKREPNGKFIEENEFNPVNKAIAIFNKPFNWKDCPDTIFDMFAAQPWQVLYKKELLNRNNLHFPNLTSSNGAALSYIARICASKIVILNKAFVNYRVLRPNAITTRKNPINQLKQFLELKEFILKHNLSSKLEQSYKNYFLKWLKYKQNDIYGKQYDEFVTAIEKLQDENVEEYLKIVKNRDFAFHKIDKTLKKDKILFWGASLFLEDFIERYHLNSDNIIGIVDMNQNKHGKFIGKYEIYSPQDIKKLNLDKIIVSIVHYTEERLAEIKEYAAKNLEKQIDIESIS